MVAILGTTFTGELEPIAEICAALDKLAAGGGLDVPVHVDAASGGFVVPFLHPDLEWDFRLPRVVSINVSGHKYGLTYPGIGFVVWRSSEYLPEDLVFRVNYLGGDMPTFTLNFSRPGNQVVGQYYNFLRLGRAGYTQVMQCLSQTARWLGDQLRESEHFEVISDGSAIPVVSFRLAGDFGYTEFDVSHALRVLRLAGAGLHHARGRHRHHRCCASWCGRASPPTWPGRCATTLVTALAQPGRAEARRPLQRAAALRPLAARTSWPSTRPLSGGDGSGTIGGGDMTMQTTELSLTPTATAEAVVDLDAIAHNVRVLREHAGSAAGDGRGQGRRLRPRRHPGRRAPRWPRARPNSASPPSTRRWRCAATASPRRCWPGCTRRAPTSGPRCRPTSQIAVSSVRQLDEVLDAVERTGRTATVTVKVDTGLNRNGVSAAEYPVDADRAAPRAAPTRRSGCAASCRTWCTATTPTTRSTTFRRSGSADMLAQARDQGVRVRDRAPVATRRPR